MSDVIYEGPFRDHIRNFIKLKQAIGYKYHTNEGHLKYFDKFTRENYPEATALTKEIVLKWCSKRTIESQSTRCSRASSIRQFAEYLDSINFNAFIIPKRYYHKGNQYVPYIYTTEELKKFFAETDRCNYSTECPYRHEIMPVIFRMIYMCGLRVSEARLLRVADVDIENGILTILQSKNDNDRLVPMSNILWERCRNYAQNVHPHPIADDYFFPALGGKPMTIGNVYHNFRMFLWRAGISHGGKGHGPRVRDFRCSFAVHCLKKWVEQEKDLMVYLAVLKTYMGHDSFDETAYYLHLTADVFPDITFKIETRYPGIIPELDGKNIDKTY